MSDNYSGQRGSRIVPITYGVLLWIIAALLVWFFRKYTIVLIISGLLAWLGWINLKIGICGSQNLIDDTCLSDTDKPLPKDSEEELNRIAKGEPMKIRLTYESIVAFTVRAAKIITNISLILGVVFLFYSWLFLSYNIFLSILFAFLVCILSFIVGTLILTGVNMILKTFFLG